MNAESNASPYFRRFRSMAPFLVVLGVLAAVWISLREYRSTATIEVRREGHHHFDDWLGSDESFILWHESLLRQSHEILSPVIEQFELIERFSTNEKPLSFLETKDRLARMIEVRGIPNTDRLEVSVYHRNAQFASKLANAIVESFNADSVRRNKNRAESALTQFEAELEAQKDRVEKQRQQMIESKDRGGIVDPDPNNSSSIATGTDQSAILNYSAEKIRFLNERKILEAGDLKLRAEQQNPMRFGIHQLEPVKIWEHADPARHRAHIAPDRLWEHHRFLSTVGLLAGFALGALIVVTGAHRIINFRADQIVIVRRGDTTTYDY